MTASQRIPQAHCSTRPGTSLTVRKLAGHRPISARRWHSSSSRAQASVPKPTVSVHAGSCFIRSASASKALICESIQTDTRGALGPSCARIQTRYKARSDVKFCKVLLLLIMLHCPRRDTPQLSKRDGLAIRLIFLGWGPSGRIERPRSLGFLFVPRGRAGPNRSGWF